MNRFHECSICYEKIYRSNFILECGHKFHIKCLNRWRKNDNIYLNQFICPYCRRQINWDREKRLGDKPEVKIRNYLNLVAMQFDKFEKLKIVIKIFKVLNLNVNKFKNQSKFVKVVKSKIVELYERIKEDNGFLNLQITDEFYNILEETNNLYKFNIDF